MNILDLITAGIILTCVIICFVKGLLISVFNLFSLFISFMLTRQLYPTVSGWLRETPLFDALKQVMSGWLGTGGQAPDTGQIVSDTVNGMEMPELFKKIVLDNIDVTQSLDLTGVYEYVAEFAAGLAIDALAMAAVFICVFLLMRVIAMLLKLVSRMPVIRTFNHIGGGVMGFVIGSLLSWLVLSVMKGLFSANADFPVADLLDGSMVAKYFMFKL